MSFFTSRKLGTGKVIGASGAPDNILAFRMITTMLSQLPRAEPVDNLESGQIWDTTDRQELRILDAFAHLALGEHNVAAVATTRSSSDSTKLHSVVCTDNLPNERPPNSMQPASLMRTGQNFFTRNPLWATKLLPEAGVTGTFPRLVASLMLKLDALLADDFVTQVLNPGFNST